MGTSFPDQGLNPSPCIRRQVPSLWIPGKSPEELYQATSRAWDPRHGTGGCTRKRPWLGLMLCWAILKFWTIFEWGPLAPCVHCAFSAANHKASPAFFRPLGLRMQVTSPAKTSAAPAWGTLIISHNFQPIPPFSRPPVFEEALLQHHECCLSWAQTWSQPGAKFFSCKSYIHGNSLRSALLLSPIYWLVKGSAHGRGAAEAGLLHPAEHTLGTTNVFHWRALCSRPEIQWLPRRAITLVPLKCLTTS